MSGNYFTIEIQPEIPARLSRMEELASNLYYSWDRHYRGLFYYLDRELWDECGHNPKVFLRRISQQRLQEAAEDRVFLDVYQQALANYDIYHKELKSLKKVHKLDLNRDLIAYFSAEFGLHESLPIYSGGLGILAGDYCKAASDLGIPFLAVGLLYRQGNLNQTIDGAGNQVSHYHPVELNDLPVQPARDAEGNEVYASVNLPPGSEVRIKVWLAKAGHTNMYLLDTDVPQNSEQDRAITYQIYPADIHNRFKQEIVLGIGGVKALDRLGLKPAVWHINEGHPCLQIIERCRQLIATGRDFQSALQQVASSTVFTTHTPVPAGHEVYELEMLRHYLAGQIQELGIRDEDFFRLGADSSNRFNMTSFSIRCSRFQNGVSQVHGQVASEMEKNIWQEIPVEDNPMGHVTNGVHVQTFLAREWVNALDDPGWHNELLGTEYWERIDSIPDATFWSIHLSLKNALCRDCCSLIEKRSRRNGYSQAQINNETGHLLSNRDALVLGFARRFATYKRATLLFDDPARLERILNNPDRPVILIFAGKAHPHDEPGKELIRRIHQFSMEPRFTGKVILLEGYDMALARRLVTGVDLWINTPQHPLEACGTSGMKAGINGVINLSVLDGWWAEGYNGENGWAIQPHVSEPDQSRRRWLENKELLDVLEQAIIPMYFDREPGYSERWIRMAKHSMKTTIPQFNAQRMVMDYVNRYYFPAIEASRRLAEKSGERATALARWKEAINSHWPGVGLRRMDDNQSAIQQGRELRIRVALRLNGLHSDDIHVECLLGRQSERNGFEPHSCHRLHAVGMDKDETIYETSFVPQLSGLVAYRLRAFPFHVNLCHPFETGFMKWV